MKRFSVRPAIALACLCLSAVLLPAAAPAAVHAQADGLLPVPFGLPAAKEGKAYSFSIAGAATGGVKPYHCKPAESFGPLWAWLHVASNCVISGTAPTLPAGTSKRLTALRFMLTDSGTPPKTVTLYPMMFAIHSKTEEFPFDGTWRVKATATVNLTCPKGVVPPPQTSGGTVEIKVADGMLNGHKLSVSVTGITATVTETHAVKGYTLTDHFEFTVTGAVTSVRETITGSGPIGPCTMNAHGTGSGSRIST